MFAGGPPGEGSCRLHPRGVVEEAARGRRLVAFPAHGGKEKRMQQMLYLRTRRVRLARTNPSKGDFRCSQSMELPPKRGPIFPLNFLASADTLSLTTSVQAKIICNEYFGVRYLRPATTTVP